MASRLQSHHGRGCREAQRTDRFEVKAKITQCLMKANRIRHPCRAPVAAPGAICLSDVAYRQVRARLDLSVSDLGNTQLKNIAEPIRVYSLQVGVSAKAGHPIVPQAAPAQPAAAAPSELPGKAFDCSPAVHQHVGDPEQDYFSDGITEDIITDLSKIAGLMVIARNSSFAYKNKTSDVRTVGRELGVTSVLEGSIRAPATACASRPSLSTRPPADICGRSATTATSPTYSHFRTK